ncbi:MAG: hypothetical protein AAGG81_09340, partial [Chlamydiota bacterium]
MLGKIKYESMAYALAEGRSFQVNSKTHGLSSDQYRGLLACWEIGDLASVEGECIHESFGWLTPLWENFPGSLKRTFNAICEIEKLPYPRYYKNGKESSPYLHSLLKTLLHENKQPLLTEITELVEKRSSLFSMLIRDILFCSQSSNNEKVEDIKVVLDICNRSEQLSVVAEEVFYEHQRVIPDEIRGLKFKNSTIRDSIKELSLNYKNSDNTSHLRQKVLEVLEIRPHTNILIKEKELALCLGDFSIRKSGLEGYGFLSAMEIFYCFKEVLNSDLRDKLKSLIEWQKHISKTSSFDDDSCFQNMANQLNHSGYLLMPFGWKNYPNGGGHAMIVEAFITKDGTVSLRFHNQGAGVNHHDSHDVPFRKRKSTYFEYNCIPRNVATSPAFWMILMGYKVMNIAQEVPYDGDDIYSWIRSVIPGVPGQAVKQGTPQQSGTCTFQTILAFIKSNCSDKEYDNIILRFKFGVLARYEEDLKYRKRPEIDLVTSRVLREFKQKLKHSVEVHRSVGTISEKIAEVLLRYCSAPPVTSVTSEKSEMADQLHSTFQQMSISFMKDSPCYLSHEIRSKGISNIFNFSPLESPEFPKKAKNLHEVFTAIKNTNNFIATSKSPNQIRVFYIIKLIQFLPSLVDINNLCTQFDSQANVSDVLKSLRDLIRFHLWSRSINGIPNPLIRAYLFELGNILVSFTLGQVGTK